MKTNLVLKKNDVPKQDAGLLGLFKPYRGLVFGLLVVVIVSNALNLLIPQLIARAIDSFSDGRFIWGATFTEFIVAAGAVFVLTALQSVIQVYTAERVAFDLRAKLSAKISRQSHRYVQGANPAKLLTNFTADIDAVKMFMYQGVVSIVSSVFIIIGASILLLMLNWRLALAILLIVPIIGGTFSVVFSKVRVFFKKRSEVIDWLNKVINESILGAGLIRVLNSQLPEYQKFLDANTKALDVGMKILALFASMMPIVSFVTNLATLVILMLGGHFVITGSMTLGAFAAFNSYLMILIFPIIIIGFMSTVIAQASASYQRVNEILKAPELPEGGHVKEPLRGDIALKNVQVMYDERSVLKNVSFHVKAGTRTAVIGPTAAGKTQFLYLLVGLITPQQGAVEYDGRDIQSYDREMLYKQIGFVFQDSIIFNMSIRENIAFSDAVTDESLRKAIETAELDEFVDALPEKLNTIVSERGTSLSGGQKQRIMLARALALNPKVLLLDDFTARVDSKTEQSILANVRKNYPGITLISVTQKISSVEDYDQIVVLMEGEVLGTGTHESLLATCPEYVQIYESQRSTSRYELHAE